MKKMLLIFLAASASLMACNSHQTVKKQESANEARVKSAAITVDPVTLKKDSLKKRPAAGLDELSAWLPEELNGIKRSNLTMSSNMGYAVAHADYDRNSKTNMRVTVYDCAGVAGADLYQTLYLNKMKEVQETAEAYTRVIDFSGGKAIEHFEKPNRITTLTYMANDHTLAVVSARNFDPETVKEVARKLGAH
ncbi:MAG: hypothetical protein ACXVM0_16750 [Flavisolibacter sp.]